MELLGERNPSDQGAQQHEQNADGRGGSGVDGVGGVGGVAQIGDAAARLAPLQAFASFHVKITRCVVRAQTFDYSPALVLENIFEALIKPDGTIRFITWAVPTVLTLVALDRPNCERPSAE